MWVFVFGHTTTFEEFFWGVQKFVCRLLVLFAEMQFGLVIPIALIEKKHIAMLIIAAPCLSYCGGGAPSLPPIYTHARISDGCCSFATITQPSIGLPKDNGARWPGEPVNHSVRTPMYRGLT